MTWNTKRVQFTERFSTEADAAQALDFCRSQVDFIAARVTPPTPAKDGYNLQALFEDCGHDLPLPDGCRRVVTSAQFEASLAH